MKIIKLKFLDCWLGHIPEKNLYYKILSRYYKVELTDNPDYIIDGGLGTEHLNTKYDRCIKLVSIGENCVPDFNLFDYAIGFDNLSFGDRYLRMPLFVFYSEFKKLTERAFQSDEKLVNRDFCSFVVSNGGGDPFRTEFFKELSKYKPVASGGRYLNNIGGPVTDKNAFCSKYKFNIAFENSVSPGYTTEKVMQPYTVNTVPIYYGNPLVGDDFNVDSMVRIASCNDMQKAIDDIIYLDTHNEAYLEKVKCSCLVHSVEWYEERLIDFLRSIFDPSIDDARRLISYGMQKDYRNRLRKLYKMKTMVNIPLRLLRYFKH